MLSCGGVRNIPPLTIVTQLLIKHGHSLCLHSEVVIVVLLGDIVDHAAEAGDSIVDNSKPNLSSCVLHTPKLGPCLGLQVEKLNAG